MKCKLQTFLAVTFAGKGSVKLAVDSALVYRLCLSAKLVANIGHIMCGKISRQD